MVVQYQRPLQWIHYDILKVAPQLTAAKAAVLSLTTIPYQRRWADELQMVQLKREVAGTSRIEGADFTENEFEAAMKESPEQLHTRSQRQAAAAVKAYRWIAALPTDRPITTELVLEIHRLLVSDADDDHCPPGQLRNQGENVTFGSPRHRGCEGGDECRGAFGDLIRAMEAEFREHDPLVQALAAHYHLAAMHPFLDGNGRTARAVEALMLQRTGLRDTLFIAMSNYYYEEKNGYLENLTLVRSNHADLTPFLIFGLKGVELQCRRLFGEISKNVSRALYQNMMHELFGRLRSPRKRVVAKRHMAILTILLGLEKMGLEELTARTENLYGLLGNPQKALIRDVNHLIRLGAVAYTKLPDGKYELYVRLQWQAEITETEFFAKVKALPKAKTHSFLS